MFFGIPLKGKKVTLHLIGFGVEKSGSIRLLIDLYHTAYFKVF